MKPFSRERERTVGRSVEADLSQWYGVSQDVDVELVAVVLAESRQREADDGEGQVELWNKISGYVFKRSSGGFGG